MIRIHPSHARGSADHGWLQTRFSFSFDTYVDRERMGYGPLRVINDDIIAPYGGFGMHPHRDMEIITVVIDGALEHADDQGHRGVIGRGEVQFMRAGSGIVHSERNALTTPLHLFQIWIYPKTKGLAPAYEQRRFDAFEQRGTCVRLVGEGGISIDQDATIDSLLLDATQRVVLEAPAKLWGRLVLVVKGEVRLNEITLRSGDEAQIEDEASTLEALQEAHVLIFELRL